MTKKLKEYYDTVIAVSISKEQNMLLEKHALKFEGNKSLVIRNLINKLK